jgi:hypothetical protein
VRVPYGQENSEDVPDFYTENVYAYMRLRPYLREMCEHFHKVATEATDAFYGIEQKLEKEFGRELVLAHM